MNKTHSKCVYKDGVIYSIDHKRVPESTIRKYYSNYLEDYSERNDKTTEIACKYLRRYPSFKNIDEVPNSKGIGK